MHHVCIPVWYHLLWPLFLLVCNLLLSDWLSKNTWSYLSDGCNTICIFLGYEQWMASPAQTCKKFSTFWDPENILPKILFFKEKKFPDGPFSKKLFYQFMYFLINNKFLNWLKDFCQIISTSSNNFWDIGSQDRQIFACLLLSGIYCRVLSFNSVSSLGNCLKYS